MNAHKLLAIMGLCVMCCLCVGMFTPVTFAQDNNEIKKNDKNSATKFGVSDSLASGDDDDEDATGKPTRFQMGLGLGSIPVAYIVMKYL
ncbi:MAG: hypothetical protein VCD00_04520 [Candidatus Hydrogenedentota bacterium]